MDTALMVYSPSFFPSLNFSRHHIPNKTAGRQFYCCPIPEVAAGGGLNCGWADSCSEDQELMTFAGTFLTTVSDVLDFTGLIGQALADVLDDIEMENMRSYCCSKDEIKEWKDCYWAVG